MKEKKTNRGFSLIEFTDSNNVNCTIQKSSSASEDKIWLGAKEIGLKHFKAGQGWVKVKLIGTIEEHYIANNRMHLNRKQAKKIAKILLKFANSGDLLLND